MAKCKVNENNEITNFWDDSDPQIPEDALDCDITKGIKAKGEDFNSLKNLWKLVDGKVKPTDAGIIWEGQEYARNRQAEYPSVQELVVALYDTDDKSAVEAKRAAVKAKYPKPG